MKRLVAVITFISCSALQPAQAQGTPSPLEGLSPTARDWVNRSCPRSLGPSLWSDCIRREASAASVGKPDLSGLSAEFRAWVSSSCPDSLGPSLTIDCLKREKAALSSGLPDVSFLTAEQKQWVSSSCPRSLGPSLFVSCVQREAGALRGAASVPRGSVTPEVPVPSRHYSVPRAGSSRQGYEIEVAHNAELFIINGEKFEAKTYCLGWEEGDEVLFLEGSALGVCVSAELLNLRTNEKCDVWCE